MKDRELAFLFDRKINAILFTNQDVAEQARSLGYGLVEVILQDSDTVEEISSAVVEEMHFCRSQGYPVLITGAEYLDGITSYQIWQALTISDGYDPNFHIILSASEGMKASQIDEVLMSKLAVLDSNGTFKELEYA